MSARSWWLRGVSAALLACAASAAQPQPTAEATSALLKSLLDEDLDAVYRRSPFQATARGVAGYNHLLPDLSLATLEKEHVRERDALARLQRMDPALLRGQERMSYDLLLDRMEIAVAAQRFPERDGLILSTIGGFQNAMPRGAQVLPFRASQDYRDFIQRLRSTPAYIDGIIDRLKLGMRTGWLAPVGVVDRIVAAIDAHLVDDADKSVVLEPFRRFAPGVQDPERGALLADAKRAITEDYQPAMRRARAFLVTEYRPKAPADGGLAALPGGTRYYDFLINSNVIRGETAASIHALGLREVARIRGEIGAIAERLGYAGTADHFIRYLSSDPGFFFTSADAVLAAYRAMPARVDPQLPRFFHSVPRMPYAVRAMTPAESASSSAANYQVGSLALGTTAYFTINALGYENEATWRVSTVFLHETVPGHHFQLARAAEIEGLHPWRAVVSGNVGYTEGWALYAERLGYPMGLYEDPYQQYGQLQAELFRAARLVVDTGIHLYGWPRDRAILYLWIQGGMDYKFALSEADRYFSNPSQALGYMMGQRKFLELRARAERALGPRFDVRDFHAVALDEGPMPLAVLEKRVDEWLRASR